MDFKKKKKKKPYENRLECNDSHGFLRIDYWNNIKFMWRLEIQKYFLFKSPNALFGVGEVARLEQNETKRICYSCHTRRTQHSTFYSFRWIRKFIEEIFKSKQLRMHRIVLRREKKTIRKCTRIHTCIQKKQRFTCRYCRLLRTTT